MMNASVYLGDKVSIGFGNSKGLVLKQIMEEKYQVIERMNLKPTIAKPRIRAKRIPEYDLGSLKQLVNRRRNQTVLKSFMGVNQESQMIAQVEQIEQQCKRMVDSIDQETQMLVALRKDVALGDFMRETGASEADAIEYMREFKGDTDQAKRVYGQRVQLVRKFSQKNGMGEAQAHQILKANQYNVALFE